MHDSDFLKSRAVLLFGLMDLRSGIKRGEITCGGSIMRDIEGLIKELGEEIFNALN